MRKKTIVGNWKMHKSRHEAREDFLAFAQATKELQGAVEVGLAVPALWLADLSDRRIPHVQIYAQNVHWESHGAFTGEWSAAQLSELGLTGSLVAHSERRQMNGETDTTAGRRLRALLNAHLRVIFCVGETLAERESGALEAVLRRQLEVAFAAAHLHNGAELLGGNPDQPLLTLAYEPVWAIGTGKAATAQEAQAAHAFLRRELAALLGAGTAEKIRIQYGGSVNLNNAKEFLSQPDIDGALVGGASLSPVSFAALCRALA